MRRRVVVVLCGSCRRHSPERRRREGGLLRSMVASWVAVCSEGLDIARSWETPRRCDGEVAR